MDKGTQKFGQRQFIYVAVAYTALLPLSIWLLQGFDLGALSFLVALVPMIPVGAGAVIIMRMVDAMDELERRIQVQAMGFAGLATGLGTFAYSLLERTGLPPLSLTWVLPIMIGLWTVGKIIARRRYR